jgi:hypothetical protein
LTRLFLELTGYPQLGGGGLHIAHVLWGGLLLFIAAGLPLVFANRWVYQVSALLTGLGIGLFMDEVGKFITQNNDYFFPPAAPIIYAFFLICVLIYLQVSRPAINNPRSELYMALEMLEDVLDNDLDQNEQAELQQILQQVSVQDSEPELARLATALLTFCSDQQTCLAPTPPRRWSTIEERLRQIERLHISRGRLRTVLAFALGILGVASFAISLTSTYVAAATTMAGTTGVYPGEEPLQFIRFLGEGYVINYWWLILQLFRGLLGVVLIASGVFLMRGRERQGLRGGYFSLLVYLTMVDLLLFYYYQFSTIITAIIQFAILMALLYYRERFAPGFVSTAADPPAN